MKFFRLVCCLLLAMVAGTAHAQRLGCVQNRQEARANSLLEDDYQRLPDPFDFDPHKTYRQPVVLVSCSDTDFSMADPAVYYNRLFNEKGFNEGMGKGCVADYFREQSEGRVNLQFDIYGPFKSSVNAGHHNGYFYGEPIVVESTKKMCETEQADFSIYDWDGDGVVNQVIFIIAGFTGNINTGYTWPNTGRLSTQLPGGASSDFASISCELWKAGTPCGIGTIVHEFCHCLGLPDIYPMTPANTYSAVDEWDLMDGGNYTNHGWCPPNLTAMEKMYLGWKSPVELTESTSIQNMRPVSDGGDTYIIRNTGNPNEFYLLENRRQEGWDYGCPGNGLLIFHVEYSKYHWSNNLVNNSDSHYRFDLFHADGKDYRFWDPANDGMDENRYTMDNWLRNRYLSTSPYPYTDPTTHMVNDCLTDSSDPAATVFAANAEGKYFMSKAITNIRLSEDGTISFDFMKASPAGVSDLAADTKASITGWYDLNGRRLSSPPHSPGIYISVYSDGTKKKKCFRHF